MKDFISVCNEDLLISSECIYHTEDNGCSKRFIPCPIYLGDEGWCLGCGGCSFKHEEIEEGEENEIDKE